MIPKQCNTWFPKSDHQCEGILHHKGDCQDVVHKHLNTDKFKKMYRNAFR